MILTAAYENFKFESGVHRVQRVPKTEKSGRIHTSTVAVAILPKPSEISVTIDPKVRAPCLNHLIEILTR